MKNVKAPRRGRVARAAAVWPAGAGRAAGHRRATCAATAWRFAAICAPLVVLPTVPAPAVGADFVVIDHVEVDALQAVPFRVHRPLTVRVECEGAGDPDHGDLYAYGWILDLRTREVVWRLQADKASAGPGGNRRWRGDVELAAGDFSAYFAPFTQHYRSVRVLGKEWFRIWIKRDAKKPAESKRWGLRLAVADAHRDAVEVLHAPPRVSDPRRFVDLTPMGDNAFTMRGFRLQERMQITVYCQGEYTDAEHGAVDGGWIVDARTRKPVWEFGPDNFKDGGGDSKNKVSRETISLAPGEYVASFSTDDSHSYAGWNAPPPYDPDGWGMILWAASEAQARQISVYEPAEDDAHALVSLVRVGDGVCVSQGFTLRRALRLRVYCLGEYDDNTGGFADAGLIEKFDGDTVWSMSEANTRHAGGARKNRVADEVIPLGPGDYVVSYATDGSHAYGAWNAAPPRDPRRWGITLFATSAADTGDFKLFDAEARSDAGKDYLVRLVRVGSNQHERARFTLNAPTRVRIVAVGEGLYNEMFDYGWIETVPGRTWVWEMTMRNTRHAGGADKNRRFDGTLLLDAGTYEAHYVTDDSHAWNDWNQPRPKDPKAWGLTIVPEPR